MYIHTIMGDYTLYIFPYLFDAGATREVQYQRDML